MSAHAEKHHIVPLSVYLAIGSILLCLTAVTVWVSFIDLGAWNIVIALLIAAIKATLVAMFFMHLLYDNKLYLIIFVTALAFLALFIGITMIDSLSRGDIYQESGGPIEDKAAMYRIEADSLSTDVIDSLKIDTVSSGH